MKNKPIYALAIIPLTFSSLFGSAGQAFVNPFTGNYLLASHEMSLNNRYADSFVNDVMKSNILLNIAYLSGKVTSSKDVQWGEVAKPTEFEFRLDPNKTFAYHEDVKNEYQGKIEKTTNAHFNYADGFKTDGYLFGDGVCHLASLINWVAKDAGLQVEAPTNHDFANIPDVPKEYGVSIYKSPGRISANTLQNLYITNNRSKPITFKFAYQNDKVKVSIIQLN